ncbi:MULTISPECIES: thioredoxin domain-containing protein [unclassified Mycolicibacterium]|uniref:DsbA family protein n=1 Tax=unclassified Mycolicibacterium TaxID=2636767 RepID=UPI001307B4A0|nr:MULTISPECIES: thioredoxin domain-containing protein [unclassified Mycolicibacterium]MUL82214.1 thioredoxin domain-containing protein [Mycolicibacterium sp. CBMA 329]MUL87980.1 thioredoxin domain-containing protein [Mycolicibacterium sp. CBMA 331]MUM02311.1 thioredoxin domain-containing protein [Mycolicibacterium sp. CBMA 334]MUM26377.1 thioredoxin domain-containing protein [Mycolicibacterium sp. CBMA 295]MUM38277.1 thioredoxin domain-containing protein [Mycolicibacterium sp. CBMA 247]
MGGRRESVKKDLIFIGGLVAIAAALIAYLLVRPGNDAVSAAAPSVTAQGTDSAAVAGSADGSHTPVERRQAGDPLALGDRDAPVALVVFSDYRCPFCAKFSRVIEPELVKRYVDAGQLRIEWRDFPIFGPQSMSAARAGRAAAEQGKFWEFNRAVYAAAPERSKADLTDEVLIDLARQAGVPDIDRFTAGMRGNAFDAAINSDLAQGTGIGVPSTPAFLINDVPLLGAQPTEEFVHAIDAALANR